VECGLIWHTAMAVITPTTQIACWCESHLMKRNVLVSQGSTWRKRRDHRSIPERQSRPNLAGRREDGG